MAGFRDKLKKVANNPFVRYGAAAATGGIPGVAAMGARDLYKHVTNKPVGLGSLPAPHPALSVPSPEVVPPQSEVPFSNLPIPDLTPPISAPPSFGLAGLSRPVDTASLGITHPQIPNLTPSVSAPDAPVDTSGLGLMHPAIPDLTPQVAAPDAPKESFNFSDIFKNSSMQPLHSYGFSAQNPANAGEAFGSPDSNYDTGPHGRVSGGAGLFAQYQGDPTPQQNKNWRPPSA